MWGNVKTGDKLQNRTFSVPERGPLYTMHTEAEW
jgi:hypothetical protein